MSLSVEEIERVLAKHRALYIPLPRENRKYVIRCRGCRSSLEFRDMNQHLSHVAQALQAALDAEKEATDAK